MKLEHQIQINTDKHGFVDYHGQLVKTGPFNSRKEAKTSLRSLQDMTRGKGFQYKIDTREVEEQALTLH